MDGSENITLGQFREFVGRVDERLDALELDKTIEQDMILTAYGWANDSGNAKYPYQYRLTVEGVTAASRASAFFDDDSRGTASVCGVCADSETAADTVVFKSRTAPTVDLTGIISIKKYAAESGT